MTAPPPLRVGSLCTGYGGLDAAVAAALATVAVAQALLALVDALTERNSR